ncbi:MAG: hypothetical protein CM15mP62_15170 [Rhodospirillaceae bacterium]|nr:MAG: hypothetical protein CM15mP62_15170 [Rhodospirillaceae bacterium]
MLISKISVLGAGAWGSALAHMLAELKPRSDTLGKKL